MLDANQGVKNLIQLLVKTGKLDIRFCSHLKCNRLATYRGVLKDPNGIAIEGLINYGNMNYRCDKHVDDIVHSFKMEIDPLVVNLLPWIEGVNHE